MTSGIVLPYLKVLIWPALVLVLVLSFRSAIRYLLRERLTRVDAAGVSATFERQAKEAVRVAGSDSRVHPVGSPEFDLSSAKRITPRSYADARQVGEVFRTGQPVILNLEQMIDSDAKRLVDFIAGLIFQDHGSIERITNKVFLLAPGTPEDRPPGSPRERLPGRPPTQGPASA
jgi:Cell division protein SepF